MIRLKPFVVFSTMPFCGPMTCFDWAALQLGSLVAATADGYLLQWKLAENPRDLVYLQHERSSSSSLDGYFSPLLFYNCIFR